MPLEQQIGAFCRFFHCLPSAAMAEWLDAPEGFLDAIMDAHAYAETKRTIDACDAASVPVDRQPTGPWVDLVHTIAAEEARRG